MKRTLTETEKIEIHNDIKQYLADELEVDISQIQDETNIIDDLGADSILFLEMFEEFKSKLQIDLEVRTIGQYMLNHPVYTFKEIIEAIYLFCEKGDELIEPEPES
jgi:acyl carrier protein